MKINILKLVIGWTLLMCMPLAAYTQPVGDLVLNDLEVTDKDGYLNLDISFVCSVRYITHFPQESGDELRIKIAPSSLCTRGGDDADALLSNEAIRPRPPVDQRVVEVAYEGDLDGGPFLVVYFKKKEHFEVIPGPDFRSLTVVVQPSH